MLFALFQRICKIDYFDYWSIPLLNEIPFQPYKVRTFNAIICIKSYVLNFNSFFFLIRIYTRELEFFRILNPFLLLHNSYLFIMVLFFVLMKYTRMRNVSQYLRLKYKFWIINYWISSDFYNITDKSQKLPFEIVISYFKNWLKLPLRAYLWTPYL